MGDGATDSNVDDRVTPDSGAPPPTTLHDHTVKSMTCATIVRVRAPGHVLDIVRGRSMGVCEICGTGRASNFHHRRPGGMGGSRQPHQQSAANLLHVDGSGTTGCHGKIESGRTLAYENGWLVHRRDDPTTVPVLRRGEWVYLALDGGIGDAD